MALEKIPAMNAARLSVTGIVQGVGFRPFVLHLAKQLNLAGSVCNTASGVCILVPADDVELFQQRLIAEHPPLARIDGITIDQCEDDLACPFEIVESLAGDVHTGATPDAAICSDCYSELNDPADRRYQYPFLNCTNCGPRFSIVQDIPYDRSNTTMASFDLCPDCQSEYSNVSDRRYHAQAIACPKCGPKIWFEHNPDSHRRIQNPDSDSQIQGENSAIQQAIDLVLAGGILALRGIGGFHLACLATDETAVAKLRKRKCRPTKPLAIMVRDLEVAKRFAAVDSNFEAQLTSSAAPIVLSPKRSEALLAPSVSCGLHLLGLMLPYTPLHHLLLSAFDKPLVMTSGNSKGAPQMTRNEAARVELAGIADGYLLHDREIENRIDDSVVQLTKSGTAQVIRRARGLAPDLISLPEGFADHPDAIAFGADSKNAFALAKGGRAVLSQYIGDLTDPRTAQDLSKNIKRLTELFDIRPSIVFCDMHRNYQSTRMARAYAQDRDLPIVHIQHHHAHAASLMVQHRLDTQSQIVALVQDGTGMGLNGDIWGAELLRVNYDKFERIASLSTAQMQGGDAAAQEPWRNLVARLLAHYGSCELWPQAYKTVLAEHPVQSVCAAISANFNSPQASSTGRLFDAVAAALGYAPTRQSYEGEAAMQLQQAATGYIDENGDPDPFAFRCEASDANQGLIQIDPAPIWDALRIEIDAGTPARAAARFHLGWADAWSELAIQWANGAPIALSGGSFQNQLLSNRVMDRLENSGKRVLLHADVPANDGGIALGQLAVGLCQLSNPSA